MPSVREWHDTVQGTAMERLEAEDSEFLARSDPTVTPLWSSPSHSSAASPHSQASITPFTRMVVDVAIVRSTDATAGWLQQVILEALSEGRSP